MITFKKFLSENELKVSPAEAAQEIFDKCQPFLKESRFDPLTLKHAFFRGIKDLSDVSNFSFNKTIKNREPSDTILSVSNVLDDHLYKKFGAHYRKDATFATPSIRTASDYGSPQMFFPIGNFTYVWSPVIKDAYVSLDNGHHPEAKDDVIAAGNSIGIDWGDTLEFTNRSKLTSSPQWAQALEVFLEKYGHYTNKDLDKLEFYSKNTEVMFVCDSYFLLSWPLGSKMMGTEFYDKHTNFRKATMIELDKLMKS